MDHSEAVRLMATERYLLEELSPEQRDAFEEHYFDCPECALDLRAEAAFVDEAKVQLPQLPPASAPSVPEKSAPRRRERFAWWRPAFALPAFAVLLLVIGYQNLATIPALRSAATQPRLVPWTTLHAGTRAVAPLPLPADRNRGAVLLIDLPPNDAYRSFVLDLTDPQGHLFWTQTVPASPTDVADSAPLSLLIPGNGLRQGAYALTITGITPQGSRAPLDRRILDLQFQ